jgi:hypothetical protein
MSKQSHRPSSPAPSPGQRIVNAEQVITALEAKHQAAVERCAEYNSAREALAFRAHAQMDHEAGKELSEARDLALSAEREAAEILAAMATAKHRLLEAQQALARQQRRDAIREQQKRCREYAELGPFLDRALDHLQRGLQALSKNAHVVGKDHRFVFATHRVIAVALNGTPFAGAFPVPDSSDKRSFPNFSHVVGQWVSTQEAALQRELAALDDRQTKNDEAA